MSNEHSFCQWTYESIEDYWLTQCANGFCVLEGNLKANGIEFCPYCGRKIKIAKQKKGNS